MVASATPASCGDVAHLDRVVLALLEQRDRGAHDPVAALLLAAGERRGIAEGSATAEAGIERESDTSLRVMTKNEAPLHDHLVGHARRREPRDVPRVPRPGVPRGLRRVAREVQEPVEGPARHRPARPQLGRRPPRRRPARRRCRRRGHLPQHRAAVLPGLRAVRGAAEARGVRAPARRSPGAQPLARRLLREPSRRSAPASVRSSSTTSTTRSKTRRGSRSTGCAAACCCRTSRPTSSG